MAGAASPDDWAGMLDRAPILRAKAGVRWPVLIRRWQDTRPEVQQPSLDRHLVILHLGGPKRVHRRGRGGEQVAEMEPGALSMVSAGSAYQWRTEGAIDYAHIYIQPESLQTAAEDLFDRAGSGVALAERVGVRDELLSALFEAMVAEATAGVASRAGGLYLDTLYSAFLGRLLADHSNLEAAPSRARAAMAPRRLAAVAELVEARLDGDITLAEMAAAAQLSPFHFARVFARTVGCTPHDYVMQRRLEAAKALLRSDALTIEAVAGRCGFASASHFAARFRRAEGVTPSAYRRRR
jgi:AraC family transcriptional regulator